VSLENLSITNDLDLDPYPCLVEVTDTLHVVGNTQVTSIAAQFPALKSVGRLRVEDNANLESIDLQLDSADQIQIYANDDLVEFDSLASIESVDSWSVWGNEALESLAGMSGLTSADSVSISSVSLVDSLADLGQLTTVGYLGVGGMPALTSLEGLGQLQLTRELHLGFLDNLTSLDGIGALNFGDEAALQLRWLPQLDSLDPLAGAQSQASTCRIELYSLPLIETLAPLASMCPGAFMESLVIFDLPLIVDLAGLEPGPDAGLVELVRDDGLVDLGALAPLVTAEILNVGSDCPQSPYAAPGGNASLETLAGLDGMTNVGEIEVARNDVLVDITAISTLQVENGGAVWMNPMLPQEQAEAFAAQAGSFIDTTWPMGICPQ
jgi:hypothetical protein